mgnify:CR=1 FL=1
MLVMDPWTWAIVVYVELIETGEALERHDEPSPTRSAVLVRLSHSHIRIGSFQRLAVTEDQVGLERLIDGLVDAQRSPRLAYLARRNLAKNDLEGHRHGKACSRTRANSARRPKQGGSR